MIHYPFSAITRLLVVMVFFLAAVVSITAQDTTYIDFGYQGAEQGTKLKPLSDLPPNGTLPENTVYLMKRGSYKFSTRSYAFTANNVTFGAYGSGDRPKIVFDSAKYGRMFDVRGRNMVVENLFLRVETVDIQSSELKSSTVLSVSPNDSVCYVRNCLIMGGFRGVSGGNKLAAGLPTYMVKGRIEFENVVVDSVGHDGFYLTYAHMLSMKRCTTSHCNLAYRPEWPNTIGGDALQCGEIMYIDIDSCSFDRSDTPGKYAMITTGYLEVRVRNSKFIGRTDGLGVACIYPGGNSIRDSNGGNTIDSATIGGKLVWFKPVWYVDNCSFFGGKFNAQIRCHAMYFNNCIFSSAHETLLDSGNEIFVRNSVFYNAPFGISNYSYGWKFINNCIFYNITDNAFKGNGVRVAGHNLYYNSKNPSQTPKVAGAYTINADPLFVDPLNGDFSLQAGSPAIDAGNNALGTLVDYLGNKRPYNGTVDIGAVEYVHGNTTMPPCYGVHIDSYYSSRSETSDGANGSLTALPWGGGSPYSFAWSNGKTGQTITGLASGIYDVTITDAQGCTDTVRNIKVLDSLIIPGRVQVENYYKYQNTVSIAPTSDSDGGEDLYLPSVYHHVTCRASVAQEGLYALSARVASAHDVVLTINGNELKTGATGGMSSWVTTDTIHVFLPKGAIDLVIGNGNTYLNVNWLEFARVGGNLDTTAIVDTSTVVKPIDTAGMGNMLLPVIKAKPVSVSLFSSDGKLMRVFCDVPSPLQLEELSGALPAGLYQLVAVYDDGLTRVQPVIIRE